MNIKDSKARYLRLFLSLFEKLGTEARTLQMPGKCLVLQAPPNSEGNSINHLLS